MFTQRPLPVTGNINPRNYHDWAQLEAGINVLSKTSLEYLKAKDISENVGDNEALSSAGRHSDNTGSDTKDSIPMDIRAITAHNPTLREQIPMSQIVIFCK